MHRTAPRGELHLCIAHLGEDSVSVGLSIAHIAQTADGWRPCKALRELGMRWRFGDRGAALDALLRAMPAIRRVIEAPAVIVARDGHERLHG